MNPCWSTDYYTLKGALCTSREDILIRRDHAEYWKLIYLITTMTID